MAVPIVAGTADPGATQLPLRLVPLPGGRTHFGQPLVPVDSGESDSLFLLDDGTAQCVIDPEGADFIKTRREGLVRQPQRGAYPCALGYRRHVPLYRATHPARRGLASSSVLFRTVGGLREAPDTRREVAELLERWKRDPRRMALFDRRRNGRIDPDEWEAARRAAYRQVQREQLQQATQPDVHLSDRSWRYQPAVHHRRFSRGKPIDQLFPAVGRRIVCSPR